MFSSLENSINSRLMDHNFRPGRGGRSVRLIVLHTEEDSPKDPRNEDRSLYNNFRGKASAHYYVMFSGNIERYVADEDTATHIGIEFCNQISIGIEHQDNGYFRKGDVRYTDAQYRASGKLVAYLCWKFDIPIRPIEFLYDVNREIDTIWVEKFLSERPDLYSGITLHRVLANTSCPDALDYMRIINEANKAMVDELK